MTGRKQIFLSDVERDLLLHSLKHFHKELRQCCDMNRTQKQAQSFCTKRIQEMYNRIAELDGSASFEADLK